MAGGGELNGGIVMRVGFIGLGLMGEPMASRLIAAGHELVVTSRRRDSAATLESLGGLWANDPATCATGCDAAILMLPDPAAVEQVVFGPLGIIAAEPLPRVVIDMSTTAPELTERIAGRLAEIGVAALDGPVSGGPVGAEGGTLSIMVGGDAQAYASVEPLLRQLGNPRLIGAAGAGQRTKLVNQLLIAGIAGGIAEAWALSQRLHLDPEVVQAVVSAGLGASPLLTFMWPRLMAGDYSPGFKIDQMIKDLSLALTEADRQGVDLQAARGTLQRYQWLSEQGDGALGTQALALHAALRPTSDNIERN